jgi:hypothetical protein
VVAWWGSPAVASVGFGCACREEGEQGSRSWNVVAGVGVAMRAYAMVPAPWILILILAPRGGERQGRSLPIAEWCGACRWGMLEQQREPRRHAPLWPAARRLVKRSLRAAPSVRYAAVAAPPGPGRGACAVELCVRVVLLPLGLGPGTLCRVSRVAAAALYYVCYLLYIADSSRRSCFENPSHI